MDPTEKENLLKRFKDYLDELEPDQEMAYGTRVISPATDLYSLFVEIAALKNEVKIESRQFKEAFDHFRGLIDPLQSGYDALQTTLTSQRAELDRVRTETLRPLLLELLELRDRMAAGEESVNRHRGSFWSKFCQQEQGMLEAVREGSAMLSRRLDQILATYQVKPFTSIGHALDPLRMRAVETSSDPDVAHGKVTRELRKGYLWDDALLRTAEVIVNK